MSPTPRCASQGPFLHPVQLGPLRIENNIWLAPLAGTSNMSFRLICRQLGAGLTCTELVSARGIRYQGVDSSWRYLQISPAEHPVAIQLFGYEPEDFTAAIARILADPVLSQCALIDLNMGCPVPKVIHTGAGAALMRDSERAAAIVAASKAALQDSGKPLTVKIRSGFEVGERSAPDLAVRLVDAGADLITVHARSCSQGYRGRADWSVIAAVVQAVGGRVPVIGNGDVTDGPSALRLLQTGCDGLMIGRAAQGNPWIFPTVRAYLEQAADYDSAAEALAELPPDAGRVTADSAERRRVILQHYRTLADELGEGKAALEMRSQLIYYLKGQPEAARLRRLAGQISNTSDVHAILELID